ncbi:MAG: O-antigen ligase family protein [Xanthobacteraceae bacterium]
MSISAAMKFDRARFVRSADWLAVAVAASLPWSTSATGVFLVIWLLALLPTLQLDALRRELTTLAGGLPVILVALAALGMLWSEVSWIAAFGGLKPFAKFLVIPLLFVQFRKSDRGLIVLGAFFASCVVLLAFSLAHAMWPELVESKSYGVPVKDYIAQSGEFVLCAFAAAYMAFDFFRAGRRKAAIAWLLLSSVFLFDVLYVVSGRTAFVTIPVLLMMFGVRQFSWKGAIGVLAVGIVSGAIVWMSSPYLRERVTNLAYEVEAYQVNKDFTSAGLRLDFWKKSLGFIAEAPMTGHGTGSIRHMFEKAAVGQEGLWALPFDNPHNQVLAVGIQLGFLGISLLLAMWLSHLLLFHQPGLIAWIGTLVVVQNIVSSLFNSHLFDFTQGWLYVFGVGVAGGVILRGRAGTRQELPPEQPPVPEPETIDSMQGGAQPQRPI